jgi:hypothetical protein
MSHMMEQLSLSLEEVFVFPEFEIDVIFWYYGILLVVMLFFMKSDDVKEITKNEKKARKKRKKKKAEYTEIVLRNGKKRNGSSGKFKIQNQNTVCA